jgi:hypothetical protein
MRCRLTVAVVARRRLQLQINERDQLLVEAAKYFPGASDREIARCTPMGQAGAQHSQSPIQMVVLAY